MFESKGDTMKMSNVPDQETQNGKCLLESTRREGLDEDASLIRLLEKSN